MPYESTFWSAGLRHTPPIPPRIVTGLGDPRFDEIVVCAKDVRTIVAPKAYKSLRSSQLETP